MTTRFFSLAGISLAIAAVFPAAALAQTCNNPPLGLIGWWRGEGSAEDMLGRKNGQILNPGNIRRRQSWPGV
jgi:hypothetical protein